MATDKAQKPLEDRIEDPFGQEISKETVRKVNILEREFKQAELEQLRHSILATRPIIEKRTELVNSSELKGHFWLRVLQNAPGSLDECILPIDAEALSSLQSLSVERFELNDKGEGEPRSIRLTFTFGENEFFTNKELVKTFWWRKQELETPKGKKRYWEGLVSEPVRIDWKADKDITRGLLGAACDFFEAEKKNAGKKFSELPEYKKLGELIVENEAAADEGDDEDEEDLDLGAAGPAQTPFFAFFGYRGRNVTAEHSAEVAKKEEERFQKILKGEDVDEEDDDEDDDEDDEPIDHVEDIEIFPDGEDVAITFAEELWPNALKLYTQTFEETIGFDDSDIEEIDMDDDEDDEEEEGDRPRKKARV